MTDREKTQKALRESIARVQTLLIGGTVEGLKMGDAGLEKEWCENTLRDLRMQLAKE